MMDVDRLRPSTSAKCRDRSDDGERRLGHDAACRRTELAQRPYQRPLAEAQHAENYL